MSIRNTGIAIVLLGSAFCAVELEASPVCPRFVQTSSFSYKMVEPDGSVVRFVQDEDDPSGLVGEGPWAAERTGSQILAMAEDQNGQRGFLFQEGFLAASLEDGNEHRHQRPATRDPDPAAFSDLWAHDSAVESLGAPPDIWSRGEYRLRLWLENPNVTAVLFAQLALCGLAMLLATGRGVKALGFLVSAAGIVCLLLTKSRGGLLAFAAGAAVLGGLRLRSLLNVKFLAVAGVLIIVAVAGVLAAGSGARFTSEFLKQDQSNSRLAIWSEVPRMMVDAPGGWGAGQSGRAYVDWYQKDSTCLLKNMISSHVTKMVEWGWAGRFVYIFAWFCVIALCALYSVRGGTPLACSLWTVLCVAAWLNPVLESFEPWVMPVAASLLLLAGCRRYAGRPAVAMIVLSAIAAVSSLVAVGFVGARSSKSTDVCVRADGGAVIVCAGEERAPSTWIVDDDYTLHGGYWWRLGRDVRAYVGEASTSVGFSRMLDDVPSKVGRLVLVGGRALEYVRRWTDDRASLPISDELVFVSPKLSALDVPGDLAKTKNFRMYQGVFAERLTPASETAAPWLEVVPGAELYLPNWLDLSTKTIRKEK